MPTPCEDLATKAELQELRDQLNHLLGEKEDGSKIALFAQGATNTLLSASAGSTLFGMAKTNAPKAVIDIIMDGAAQGTTAQGFLNGTTSFKTKHGNGATRTNSGMNSVAKTAGGAAVASETAAGVGGTAAGATALLGGLVLLAATLGLNKATVDIFDYRINQEAAGTQFALDAQNASMLRLHEKHNGDIAKINQEIAINNQRAAETNFNIQTIKTDLTYQQSQINEHNSKLEEVYTQIGQLQAENNEHILKINELTEELNSTKADLTNQINTVNTQLEAALLIIEQQKADIEKTNERIALYEARATEIETRLTEYEARATEIEQGFAELRSELDLIKELNPYLITEQSGTEEEEFKGKVTYYENAEQTYERLLREHNKDSASVKEWSVIVQQELNSEITERLTRYELQAKKHGFTGNQIGNVANTQTAVLEVAQKLSDPLKESEVITSDDVRNEPEKFRDKLKDLLDNITPDKVTPEDIEEIKTKVGVEVATVVNTAVIPRLNDLHDRVSEPNISQAVETGICRSLNGGSCPATPTVPNPVQGLKGWKDELGNILSGADLLQNTVLLNQIKATTKRIDDTIHHARHGIENAFNFAEKAWKATHADKVLQVVNTTLLVHNAMMLSNNLLSTMGEATNMALQAIGIKDHANNPIDVNVLVKTKIKAILSNVLGASNYAALTARIARANRIYQSGANVLYNVRSIIDSSQDIAETTGENVSVIGNALRKAGVVRENAYKLMPTDFRNPSRVIHRLEKLGNAASVIEEISSDALDVSQELKEMKANHQVFNTELAKEFTSQSASEKNDKDSILAVPEPKPEDESRSLIK